MHGPAPAASRHLTTVSTAVVVLAALAVMVSVAGCTGGSGADKDTDADASAAPSSSPSASVSPKPPEVGSCHRLTFRVATDGASAPDDDVDCATSHTTETYLTGAVPDRIAALPYDGRKMMSWVLDRCGPEVVSYLGNRWDRIRYGLYDYFYFLAPKQAFAAGAHWFRCDTAAADYGTRTLVPVKGSLRDVLQQPVAETYTRCQVKRGKKLLATSCDARHTGRPVGVALLGNKAEKTPRVPELTRRAKQACDARAGRYARRHGQDYYTYNFFGPDTGTWRRGDTYTVCYVQTAE
jgi:cytochrome c5